MQKSVYIRFQPGKCIVPNLSPYWQTEGFPAYHTVSIRDCGIFRYISVCRVAVFDIRHISDIVIEQRKAFRIFFDIIAIGIVVIVSDSQRQESVDGIQCSKIPCAAHINIFSHGAYQIPL